MPASNLGPMLAPSILQRDTGLPDLEAIKLEGTVIQLIIAYYPMIFPPPKTPRSSHSDDIVSSSHDSTNLLESSSEQLSTEPDSTSSPNPLQIEPDPTIHSASPSQPTPRNADSQSGPSNQNDTPNPSSVVPESDMHAEFENISPRSISARSKEIVLELDQLQHQYRFTLFQLKLIESRLSALTQLEKEALSTADEDFKRKQLQVECAAQTLRDQELLEKEILAQQLREEASKKGVRAMASIFQARASEVTQVQSSVHSRVASSLVRENSATVRLMAKHFVREAESRAHTQPSHSSSPPFPSSHLN